MSKAAGFIRIHTQAEIACSPEELFRYVTTPARWREWHHSSLRTGPGADQPLIAGARFEEDIRAGAVQAHLSWRVDEVLANQCWIARAEGTLGIELTLRYDFTTAPNGVLFQRTLDYRSHHRVLHWLHQLVLRHKVESESKQALRELQKQVALGMHR
ncbi:SRPBCC family protein [Atopomonas sediminilitoris]|uniref:SRPBCC family protein n=1 Tax=Atopomonas sediminilitoris TaxID=2919919 RepID=UPI001F4D67EB|nr:SRPBCC family protein [Atopomonas sediminilitoris]MCJ8169534.1 SRPBCC family protein [Atopomonas sediminilitoris]